jgi:hypothetical protein
MDGWTEEDHKEKEAIDQYLLSLKKAMESPRTEFKGEKCWR